MHDSSKLAGRTRKASETDRGFRVAAIEDNHFAGTITSCHHSIILGNVNVVPLNACFKPKIVKKKVCRNHMLDNS